MTRGRGRSWGSRYEARGKGEQQKSRKCELHTNRKFLPQLRSTTYTFRSSSWVRGNPTRIQLLIQVPHFFLCAVLFFIDFQSLLTMSG